MRMKLAAMLLLCAALAVVAYGTWYRSLHPPRVVATGSVAMTDPRTGEPLVFPRRTLAIGSIRTDEVQLPGGTWIDCVGDCRDTLSREHLEFWERRQLKR